MSSDRQPCDELLYFKDFRFQYDAAETRDEERKCPFSRINGLTRVLGILEAEQRHCRAGTRL